MSLTFEDMSSSSLNGVCGSTSFLQPQQHEQIQQQLINNNQQISPTIMTTASSMVLATATQLSTSSSKSSPVTSTSTLCENSILHGNNLLRSTPICPSGGTSFGSNLNNGGSQSCNSNMLSRSLLNVTNNCNQQTVTSVSSLATASATSSSTPFNISTNNSLMNITTFPPVDSCTHLTAVTTGSSSGTSVISPLLATSSTTNQNNSASSACSSSSSSKTSKLLLSSFVAGCINNLNNQQQHHQHQVLTDDTRTLQLALELSMASLNNNETSAANNTIQNLQHQPYNSPQHLQHLQQHNPQNPIQTSESSFDFSNLNAINVAVTAATHTNLNNSKNISNGSSSSTLNQFNSTLLTNIEDRSKKSQNMTECVPVPSSEHVAEIVGRQGCKIKALRAKTNTYIKTPVRGEEPVFVVTGRKEDVAKAKREILSAAEHFSLIRATRKPSLDGSINSVSIVGSGNNCGNGSGCGGGTGSGGGKTPPGPPAIPGQITITVRVPYRVVGLVVGPKGATIKHIQHETQTYIVTPSRDKEPIFEVTGSPENVQSARKQIEAHIALRTGNLSSSSSTATSVATAAAAAITKCIPPFGCDANAAGTLSTSVHTINTLSQILNDVDPEFLASIYKNGICSAFDYMEKGPETGSGGTSTGMGINLNFSPNENLIAANQMLMNSLTNGNHHTNIHGMENINSNTNNTNCLNAQLNNCSNEIDTLTGASAPSDMDVHQFTASERLQPFHHTIETRSTAQVLHETNFTNGYVGINSSINACHIIPFNQNASEGGVSGAGGVNTIISRNVNVNQGITRSCSSASSTTSSKSTHNSGGSSSGGSGSGRGSGSGGSGSRPELMNIWKNLGDSLDNDEGIGDSPSIWTLPTTSLAAFTESHCSPTSTSVSPTDSLLGEISIGHANLPQKPNATSLLINNKSFINRTMQQQQLPPLHLQQQHNKNHSDTLRQECLVCSEKEIGAILVPCGHNMFCMECASRICATGGATCPICSVTVYHAIRILA